MALDGVFDHGLPFTMIFSDNARAYEDSLTRLAAWCAADTGCALHGRDALALYDSLVQRANRQPIPAPGCAKRPCRRIVSGSDLQLAAYNFLLFKQPVAAFGEPGWNGLAQALARRRPGTPAPSPSLWRPARERPRSPAWRSTAPTSHHSCTATTTSPP